MITILHGEDQVKSRTQLENLKSQKSGCEVVTLVGGKFSLTELKQALEAKSLFGLEKLIILENVLGGKKSREQEKIIEYLKNENHKVEVIFWEDDEISRTTLHLFPQAKIYRFNPDSLLFRFLETLKSGNAQKMIAAFRQALTQEEINLIFYMLVRQLRMLLFFSSGGKDGLEETDRLADWQKAKIKRQAEVFRQEELLLAYRQLLEIDYREKTGLASYPLPQTLELFLATL